MKQSPATRYFLPPMLLMLFCIVFVSSCSEGGEPVRTSGFVAIITQASSTYLASSHGFTDRLKDIFRPVEACAIPDLSIDMDEFSAEFPVPDNTGVYILRINGEQIAYSETDATGRVEFDDVPSGYLRLLIIGGAGKTWSVQTHVDPDHDTFMRVVLKDNDDGDKAVYAKSVHNDSGLGSNIDDFSIAVHGRRANSMSGGIIVLHDDGETFIDNNGDGDFTDDDDRIITEADDDGISSADGDDDEDNDGILDVDEQGDDDDIDGDGLENSLDSDDDGDGIPDISDDTPGGI